MNLGSQRMSREVVSWLAMVRGDEEEVVVLLDVGLIGVLEELRRRWVA